MQILNLCARLTVCFAVGVAVPVYGDAEISVAYGVLQGVGIPPGSRDRTMLGFTPSPGQDAVAVGCALDDGICICDSSARRGTEADALVGMA